MKYAVASEHRDYFHKHQAIEFESLIPQEQLSKIIEALDSTLAQRCSSRARKVRSKESPDSLFMEGHDLWRDNAEIKKLSAHRCFAEIASELIEKKPLRLGCDQFFPAPSAHSNQSPEPYAQLVKKQVPLKEICCLQGVLCGLMLCLENLEQPQEAAQIQTDSSLDIFTGIPGNGVFFSPDAAIDFHLLQKRIKQSHFLIVYTQSKTQYILQPLDPHAHALKKLGYSLGDSLTDKLHPIVFR